MKKILFLILLLSGLTAPLALAQVAQLENVQGTVKVLKQGSREWALASNGMPLEVGDKVKTSEQSTVSIAMQGATFDLSEKTEFGIKDFSVNADQVKSSFDLELGRLKAKVDKMKAGSELKVFTPTSVASVRGTIFDLWVFEYEGELFTRLGVAEGGVVFCNLDGSRCILVKDNEHATSGEGGMTDIHEEYIVEDLFDAQPGFDQEPEDAQQDIDEFFGPEEGDDSSSDDDDIKDDDDIYEDDDDIQKPR